jgi:hypothetical protein
MSGKSDHAPEPEKEGTMASSEQYEGVPREYNEPDVLEPAPGTEGYQGNEPVVGDERYATGQALGGEGYTRSGYDENTGDVVEGGQPYLGGDATGEPVRGGQPYVGGETAGEPVGGGQPYVGGEYDETTGVAGTERYRASGYDETRPDFNPREEGRRAEFAERWSEEPDTVTPASEGFGSAWSAEKSDAVTTERAAEFGERWAVGPDDSAVRSEEFGAAWAGDNQPDTEPERDV